MAISPHSLRRLSFAMAALMLLSIMILIWAAVQHQ